MWMSLDQIKECLLDQVTGNVSWISPQGMSLGLIHKECNLAPFTGNMSRSVQREYPQINLQGMSLDHLIGNVPGSLKNRVGNKKTHPKKPTPKNPKKHLKKTINGFFGFFRVFLNFVFFTKIIQTFLFETDFL
jgi:hypothetical protein